MVATAVVGAAVAEQLQLQQHQHQQDDDNNNNNNNNNNNIIIIINHIICNWGWGARFGVGLEQGWPGWDASLQCAQPSDGNDVVAVPSLIPDTSDPVVTSISR